VDIIVYKEKGDNEMDPMVLASQEYLNATYGTNPGFNTISEDGVTGWQTINAIIRGFQIDKGISPTADSFGPASQTAFNNAYGSTGGIVQQADNDPVEDNVYALLQCALWCKGYSTGASVITRHFYGGTGGAIKSMKADMGINASTSTVTLNVMKSLLSMDQYKLVPNGSSLVRGFQQTLNSRYEAYIGIIPADGIYGRVTSIALIYAMQAEASIPVGTANGVFGPTTRSTTPTIPYNYSTGETNYNGRRYTSTEILHFSQILDFALEVNGFGDGNIDGIISTSNVQNFQTFVGLPSTGVVNLQTWMSLLLSTGDNTRIGVACDTRFEITSSRLSNLQAHNYQYVGRYLTGGDFKEIRNGELLRIFNVGMRAYPIYQSSGNYAEYFSPYNGNRDALLAEGAARFHNVPRNTIIYFAVDFDAMDYQVTEKIIPYFTAIAVRFSAYRVGIYGPRNVCSRVRSAGLSISSFVSGMSTGFSGNIGFPLPSDWAYDQISNKIISHAGDNLEIDNNIYSGRDSGFGTLASTYFDSGETYAAPHLHTAESFALNGEACVSLYSQDIPVYSDIVYDGAFVGAHTAGGSIIGYIHPNDCYCRTQAFGSVAGLYRVIIHDPNKGYINGFYDRNAPITFPPLDWPADQYLFRGFNSNGTSLVSASGSGFSFELKKKLDYMSTAGDLLGVLNAGTIITPYNDNPTGVSYPNFMKFEATINGSPFTGFIDFGLQFGASPSKRAIW